MQCPKIKKCPPVPRRFGQLVLRFPVVRVQAEHEAASAQLGLRLLQLLGQVEHLARGVVRVLTVKQHKHSVIYTQSKQSIYNFSTKTR